MTDTQTRDFLAIVSFGTGSSYGRAPTQEKAVALCKQSVEQDWSSLFDLHGKECKVNVYDVTGHDQVNWGYDGIKGDNPNAPEIKRIDLVTVTLNVPKHRRR